MPEPGEDSNTSSNSGVDGNDSTNNSVIEKYCVCNGTDDSRCMTLYENEQCSSGTWFHFECLNITRKPQGR